MGTPAYNVAGIYQQIHRDLAKDTHEAPDFQTALAVHELLDQVRKAGETGAALTLKKTETV
ncbi:hypothetical protein [Paenibacillus sp. AR247]|nr:hypothetical protein [Paenibacillus sp. AR247]